MYYVITNNGVLEGNTIEKLNKKYKLHLGAEDFKAIGEDNVVTISNENMEYVKDLRKISQIPIDKLFKGDNQGKFIQYVILGVSIFNLIKG